MLKNLFIMVVLTIVIVLTSPYFQDILNLIAYMELQILHLLALAFSNNQIGIWLGKILALLILPLLIGALFSLLAWSVNRKTKLKLMFPIVWAVWIILAIISLMNG